MVEVPVAGVAKAILRASSATQTEPFASFARWWKVGLPFSEIKLLGRVEHVGKLVFQDISELPSRFDKEITGIDIAVVLNHHILAAFVLQCAFRRGKAGIDEQERFEEAYGRCGRAVNKIGHP